MPNSKLLKDTSDSSNNRWVLILPEQDASQVELDNNFVTLPHPKTGQNRQYFLRANETELFEVIKFNDHPRSWFVDNNVMQDGSLYIVTSFDPLFMILPFLRNTSLKFMLLDQILQDSEHHHVGKLSKCISPDELSLLCDTKGDDDILACKLNDEKVISWLKIKVQQTKEKLEALNICTSGAQASTFVRSKKSRDSTQDDYLRYSFGLVSDYISDYWCVKLKVSLGIIDEMLESSEEEPASKKVKLDESVAGQPNEDYSKYFAKNKKTDQNSNVKLTAAQRSLAKVNKKGMKTIASFFGAGGSASKKSK